MPLNTRNFLKAGCCAIAIATFWLFVSSFNDREHIATIDHRYEGCFGGGENKVTIYKQSNNVIARLKVNDQPTVEITLDAAQLDSLQKFVEEFKLLKERPGCTTVNSFTVTYEGEVMAKEDVGCSWTGFERLVYTLLKGVKPGTISQ